MKKYEFTGETLDHEIPASVEAREHVTVYRIRALVDIPEHNVKKGDIGGWIEKEENLSHEGDCWVGNGIVTGSSTIKGHVLVGDNDYEESSCYIRGNSHIEGTGMLSNVVVDNSIVNGHVALYGTTFDFSYVEGNVETCDGFLKRCHVKSNGEKIVFFDCVLIPCLGRVKITNQDGKTLRMEHVRIDFEKGTGDQFINAFGEIKDVYSDNLTKLEVNGQLDIQHLDLKENVSLIIPSSSKNVKIKGLSKRNPVCFTSGIKRIWDTQIEGIVKLNGNLTLIKSTVFDYAEVHNHSEADFILDRIKMSDYSKVEGRKPTKEVLEDFSLVADEHLVLN